MKDLAAIRTTATNLLCRDLGEGEVIPPSVLVTLQAGKYQPSGEESDVLTITLTSAALFFDVEQLGRGVTLSFSTTHDDIDGLIEWAGGEGRRRYRAAVALRAEFHEWRPTGKRIGAVVENEELAQ